MSERALNEAGLAALVTSGKALLELLDDYMMVASITANDRYERALEAFRTALSTTPAPVVGVEVKPLEWGRDYIANEWHGNPIPYTGPGYLIKDDGHWCLRNDERRWVLDQHGDVKAAKAAAQADYEARIRSALIEPPAGVPVAWPQPVRDLMAAAQRVYDKLASETASVNILDQEALGIALKQLRLVAPPPVVSQQVGDALTQDDIQQLLWSLSAHDTLAFKGRDERQKIRVKLSALPAFQPGTPEGVKGFGEASKNILALMDDFRRRAPFGYHEPGSPHPSFKSPLILHSDDIERLLDRLLDAAMWTERAERRAASPTQGAPNAE